MRICSETHSIFWHNKEFAQVVSQNYCWRSTQLHHVATFLDVSRFAAFCSTTQHPVCIRPIVDSLPDFTNSFPNFTVAANCAATGPSIRMFAIMHPSRCFPSFVVVVMILQPSLTNMFGPFTDFASRQWFRECVRWISLTCNNIQLQVTKVPLDSATANDVSANVSDVHRFHVFSQPSLLLSCHCRFVLEHRSSSLGNVIEFPSSCTLLGSKRSTQLLRLITQQASAKMTCVAINVCSSHDHACRALASKQISSPIRDHNFTASAMSILS